VITIFTVPLPFLGSDKDNQCNAIKSWTLLNPRPEIILIGDESGVSEFAAENDIRHSPNIGYTVDGHISIASMFEIGQREASYDIVALVDSDIILMNDFLDTVSLYKDTQKFLLGGYRRAIQIGSPLTFLPGWQQELKTRVTQHGHKFSKNAGAGSDYAVFRKGLFVDVPDFSLGLGHWDGWRMWYALQQGCELVDCTERVFAVHQNHPWRVWRCEASKRNLELAEDKMSWVFDSTRKL